MHSERSWLTPYNYVQNNPVNLIDPTGMIDVDPDPPGGRLPEGNPNYGIPQFPEGGLEGPPQKIELPTKPTPEVPRGIDPSNIPSRTPADVPVETPAENKVDWGKVTSGTITAIGGGAAAVFGIMGIISGVASPAGVAGVTFGVPTMGLGMATMIDGFQGGKQSFPSGPLEATDIGFGGDGSMGQILDVFSGGFPRNAASALFMGYGLYNSNIGRAMLNPPLIAPQPPSGSMPYIAPRDNTNVAMPIIRF
ncbi:hypothetical protein DES35_1107 [Schleiferia thermophila]|uniref:RHS repeat-associated protein n=2 Tax=Schleiferia thermophila TaxID=884107 RepID=A0A368ZVL9_9FLAO|nr:hypothetical protein DES35_1107 [Schleiferia thermophila]GCD80898.1 hypothetical protein JCM30197_21450 [Schleiferia thermophila]